MIETLLRGMDFESVNRWRDKMPIEIHETMCVMAPGQIKAVHDWHGYLSSDENKFLFKVCIKCGLGQLTPRYQDAWKSIGRCATIILMRDEAETLRKEREA